MTRRGSDRKICILFFLVLKFHLKFQVASTNGSLVLTQTKKSAKGVMDM